MFMLIPRVTRT